VRFGRVLLRLHLVLALLFLITPILIVVPLSFSNASYLRFPPPGWSLRWYLNYLDRPEWLDATWLSVWVGCCVSVLSVVLGTLAAFGLTRGRFLGRALIAGLVMSPLAVPVIVLAIGVYFTYARLGLVGRPVGLILAHTCLAVPFVVATVSASLAGFDRRLELAAMGLGARRVRIFWSITLPIVWPGVFTGAVFAFITSFDELVVALFLSGSDAVTLPRRMWDEIRFEIDPTIAAVSTVLIVVTTGLMLGAELLKARK